MIYTSHMLCWFVLLASMLKTSTDWWKRKQLLTKSILKLNITWGSPLCEFKCSFALLLLSAAHSGNRHSKTWAPKWETILTTFFGSALSPPPAFPCQHVLLSVICKCWANVMYCYTLFRFEGHRFSIADRMTRVGAFIFWDYSLLSNKQAYLGCIQDLTSVLASACAPCCFLQMWVGTQLKQKTNVNVNGCLYQS